MSESIELSLETLPHSLTMEQAVIGGLLTGEGWEDVSGLLTEQDFFSPRHAVMFRAIAAMSAIGQPIDPLHMLDWLISNSLDSLAGGEAYLGDLVRNTPATTVNLRSYATRVRDLSIRRRLAVIGEEIRAMAADGARELPDLLSESDAMISALLSGRVGSGIRMTSGVKLMRDVFNDAIRASENPGISGITTGLKDLDEKSDGLQKGNSIVVAAPPSMGKTAFAMSLVLSALPHVKHPIVVFSMEMPALDIGRRMIANISGVSYTSIKRGFVFTDHGGDDGARMTTRMPVLQTENLIVCDESGLTPAMMRAVLRGIITKNRNGECGTVHCGYDGATFRFHELGPESW